MASSTGQSGPGPCTPPCTGAWLQERHQESEHALLLHTAPALAGNPLTRTQLPQRCSNLVIGFTLRVQERGKYLLAPCVCKNVANINGLVPPLPTTRTSSAAHVREQCNLLTKASDKHVNSRWKNKHSWLEATRALCTVLAH